MSANVNTKDFGLAVAEMLDALAENIIRNHVKETAMTNFVVLMHLDLTAMAMTK